MDVMLAVNGTLMRGLELNANLLAVGARFLREARTAPIYALPARSVALYHSYPRGAPPDCPRGGVSHVRHRTTDGPG